MRRSDRGTAAVPDISERDLVERLLDGIDQERAALARQLHDDIGQHLALLLMDLEGLMGVTEPVREAFVRAHVIARKVQELSHRLHPPELALVGFIPALHGLRRDMLSAGMPVTIEIDGALPALPPETALCLYRVAEAALRNAHAHSGARDVQVRIASGSGQGLSLSIADDGGGFDAGRLTHGLGLTVIRRRLETIGGSLEIVSTRGRGTVVTAIVPDAACRQTDAPA